MANETRYPDELRLPIVIKLPWSGRMAANGGPWPMDSQGQDWPSENGQPRYPLHELPPGAAPGTGDIDPPSDARSPVDQFADIDRALAKELDRVRQDRGSPKVGAAVNSGGADGRRDTAQDVSSAAPDEPNRALYDRGLASSPRADAILIPSDEESHTTGVPLRDLAGQPVVTASRAEAVTPAAYSTEFFYQRGKEDADRYKDLVARWKAADQLGATTGDPETGITGTDAGRAMKSEIELELKLKKSPLANFGQQALWDVQRFNSPDADQKFIEAASIYIGVYAAAAGLPESMTQEIQNDYAYRYSRYKDRTMDKVYSNLPVENIKNVGIGYDIVSKKT